MIDDFAKKYLHNDLREIRKVMLWKLDGLGEYNIRRPLTSTGTNLLGLVKHLSMVESRCFGEVFDRPFAVPLPRWNDAEKHGADMWATEHGTGAEVVGRYRRAWEHSDATITALDSPGHVPWWPRRDVKLFNVLAHALTETSRHAGHADIMREQLDKSTGTTAQHAASHHDGDFWEARCAKIERAARAAVTEPDHAGAHITFT
ncbi:DinB family protein [Streptomyces cyaneofuscatus]|uniref:DinB family protein n=1 Tax=Streptomyces cyaneofuscatus TaxID=66883 RepID=UPI0036DB429D